MSSKEKLLYLSSFWRASWIHKRKSDYSWKTIISSFSKDCPYPVWHKDEWLKNSNPPFWEYNFEKDFFSQIWEIFKKSPISHNIWASSENCEYTDDCCYSKNCYLCHSLWWCEDCRYIYRSIRLKDCYFCVYSFDSSKCIDLSYCFDCYNIKYAIDSKRCKNSSFLYDCQDCEDCFLCWNLRNKKYYIWNKKYTKIEYENEIKKYNLKSRKVYKQLEKTFSNYIQKNAYWKNLHIEWSENSAWDYLTNVKNSQNCFFIEECEDCENLSRAFRAKSSNFWVSIFDWEKIENTSMAQDWCFDVKNSYNINTCKYIDYSAHLYKCENCFACCWLVEKKFYILNKAYSEEEYFKLKDKIISNLKEKWIYWQFFPAYFSATSYEESLAQIYNPLTYDEQKRLWYRVLDIESNSRENHKNISSLIDNLEDWKLEEIIWSYYDEKAKRPFQITEEDIQFYKKIWVSLHEEFYISRIQRNYSWMFPELELRNAKCSKSQKEIMTSLPENLDWQILSKEEYEKIIY